MAELSVTAVCVLRCGRRGSKTVGYILQLFSARQDSGRAAAG